MSRQKSLNEQLIGTWTLVSWESRNAEGAIARLFGAHPKGIAVFDASGRYVITVMRSDRANFAIDDFAQIGQSTAQENQATARGTIAYFGTYAVNEDDRTIAIHVEASSFPNWNGTDQERSFEVVDDKLTLTVRRQGRVAHVRWRRAT
jgi:hypothetical protein